MLCMQFKPPLFSPHGERGQAVAATRTICWLTACILPDMQYADGPSIGVPQKKKKTRQQPGGLHAAAAREYACHWATGPHIGAIVRPNPALSANFVVSPLLDPPDLLQLYADFEGAHKHLERLRSHPAWPNAAVRILRCFMAPKSKKIRYPSMMEVFGPTRFTTTSRVPHSRGAA